MFSVKMETEQRFHNSNKRYDIERRIFYSCDNQVLIVLVAAISLVTGKKTENFGYLTSFAKHLWQNYNLIVLQHFEK